MLITPFIPLVEAWLRADLRIKGTVVHERLVAEYGFSVDTVRDYYTIVPDPELTLESYVTKVVNVANVFAKAITGADAKPAKADDHFEVLGGREVDKLPGEVNLNDIPF